ncbi:MAG: GNAT family N-acetyltransferase [Bdellovibrionales bacterium]
MVLRELVKEDKDIFYEALSQPFDEDFQFAWFFKESGNSFSSYLQYLKDNKEGRVLPGQVRVTFLIAIVGGKIVGRCSIRHELNDFLSSVGGHIGYGVLPRYRKMGYATEILGRSLDFIRNSVPDINKVLITCDEENLGSKKVIEKNNGVFESILERENLPNKLRYWISV